MTANQRKEITKRCGKCAYGGLESRAVHCNIIKLPICFHWYHPGEIGGCGTEWAEHCSLFNDTGKVGIIERTISIRR